MDNNILGVNVDSLKKVSNELVTINNEINNQLSYIKKEYETKLDEILNTNSSKLYKEKVIEFLNNIIIRTNTNNEYLISKLIEISDIYNNLNANIYASVDGKDGDLNGKR